MNSDKYTQHKNATIGDTARLTTEDGTLHIGTVTNTPGATVYIQTNTKQILETRRINPNNPQILLSIDGKSVEYQDPTTTDSEIPITHESATLSFDTTVTSFETETQQLTIG